MLNSLRRIVQEVGSSTSLEEAVAVIVRRVKEAMSVDVCSIYLNEGHNGHYVLAGTDGLNPDSVGTVRLAAREGLVGLVGERQEPVNLKDASNHRRFRYFPETGEERYHAFLGVPIIHYRRVMGVLVVQQSDQRLFDDADVAFLITAAAQLAAVLSHAAASRGISNLLNGQGTGPGYIQGVRGAPGIAMGTVTLPDPLVRLESVPDRGTEDIQAEKTLFRNAVAAAQNEMRATRRRLGTFLPREARAVFDVYLLLLRSSSLISDTLQRIRQGAWAPGALRDTINEHARVFDQMDDAYMRARAEDIRDVGRQILIHLQPDDRKTRDYPENSILLGDEVSVTQIAEVPVERLSGIVCTRGSAVAHTAVLARALGIPAVMGLTDLPRERLEGREMIIDGYEGRVYVNPANAVRAEYMELLKQEQKLSAELEGLRELPAETPDGARIGLYVNAGLRPDVSLSVGCGAEGIGLYRTEFPFMMRESFPGEQEQYQLYRSVLESFSPRPVTMRTLDAGGDKALPYFSVEEDNPFLGWRGIRLTLDHPEIFLTQVRAMLRANAGLENLRILFPMISRVDEVDEALRLFAQAYEELGEEGLAVARPQVGIMVEVPAAVYQAGALARRVDFLTVGTNDLTQYLLAVDRNNAQVAGMYDSLHPAVLQAILEIVRKAREWKKPVSVCGEIAGNPGAALLLMAMGVDSLSMAVSRVPRVKWAVRSLSMKHADELLKSALEMEYPAQTRRLLDSALESAGLGALIKAGT